HNFKNIRSVTNTSLFSVSSKRVISFSAIGEFFKDDISQLQRGENAFESGNVHKMLFDAEVSPALLRGEVAASMKKKMYAVEISYDLDDGIVCAKCSCPRGLAVCHHMAALCIHAHHNISVTDKTCLWSKRKPAETKQVTKISDIYKPKYSGFKAAQRSATESEIVTLIQSIGDATPVGFTWWLLPEPSVDLMLLPDIEAIIFSNEYTTAPNKEDYFLQKCCVSESIIKKVAEMTIGQSNNANWLMARKYRLTSSKFGAVLSACQKKKYPKSLFKGLLEGYDLSGVRAVQWGRENEQSAIEKFQEITGLHVEPAGFCLDECGFLGASPDGYISENCIIEVKCPFKHRNAEKLSEVLTSNENYVVFYDNSSWSINENHIYYHQVQGQLYITNKDMCYLVIWIPKDTIIMRISRNDEWKNNINTLKSFYCQQFLANILL
ncbi:unnamed protein product, partial [Acanthoscelides obtectus]